MSLESLWEIQAKRSRVKCVLQVEQTWAELLVLQDEEVAVRELFPDAAQARDRARLLKDRLVKIGWDIAS